MSKTLQTEVRHGAARRWRAHGPLFTVVKVLGLALSVLLVSGLCLGYIVTSSLTAKVDTFDLGDPAEAVPQIGAYSGEVNLLLIGSDSRVGQKGSYGAHPDSNLNDVNILFHLSKDHQKATAVSIPRDTYVDQPACKTADGTLSARSHVKINSILAYGGLRCVRDTVADMTGLKIPFVGLISFDGVVAMSNAVGGVQVCVASRIDDRYTGLHLSKGLHTLKGTQALEFLRTRHGVGDGSDLTRISSQQVYMSALVRKLKSSATLSDVTKLYPLATALAENVTLSTTLDNPDTLVTIAQAFAPIDLSKVVFLQYPTHIVGDGVEPTVDTAKILFDALRADKTLKLTSKSTSTDSALPGSVAKTGKGASSSPSATPSASPSPSASDDTIKLPASIPGQTAAQETCSVGNGFIDAK